MGFCYYGDKCRFAHGKQELVKLTVNQKTKNRKCNGYWRRGYCNYGARCQFGHEIKNGKSEKLVIMEMAKVAYGSKNPSNSSRLYQILGN